MANQSKTNVTGRVDEHGIFRHRIPELCGFGGIGLLLFSHFHILQKPKPQFELDFNDAGHSEFGRRDWYTIFLFPGKPKTAKEVDGSIPMTYDSMQFSRIYFSSH